MVTNTANRLSYEREKHTKIIITNNSEPYVQSCEFWAIWHSGTMSWPSGHLGLLKPPGNVQRNTNTSGMTLWHAGTLLAWLACWHSRQTHGTGKPMMTHHSLTLGRLCWHTQMMWLVYGWWWCIWWWSWCHFWVRAGRKPVHTQKTGPTP